MCASQATSTLSLFDHFDAVADELGCVDTNGNVFCVRDAIYVATSDEAKARLKANLLFPESDEAKVLRCRVHRLSSALKNWMLLNPDVQVLFGHLNGASKSSHLSQSARDAGCLLSTMVKTRFLSRWLLRRVGSALSHRVDDVREQRRRIAGAEAPRYEH